MNAFAAPTSTIPATAVTTTSHHPACEGRPPKRTTRVSTGVSTGSEDFLRKRPRDEKGEIFWVRTSQLDVAASTERTKAPVTMSRTTVTMAYIRSLEGLSDDPVLFHLVGSWISLGGARALGPRQIADGEVGQCVPQLGQGELARAHVAWLLLYPHHLFEI